MVLASALLFAVPMRFKPPSRYTLLAVEAQVTHLTQPALPRIAVEELLILSVNQD